MIVALAIATGIAPSVWLNESPETIATAVELMNERSADR